MRYLHTMLRVRNLDDALDFYVNKLGLRETVSYTHLTLPTIYSV